MMTDHEKNLLLATLKYYLPMDVRAKVMRDVPNAYNAWMNRPIMETRRISDGKVY